MIYPVDGVIHRLNNPARTEQQSFFPRNSLQGRQPKHVFLGNITDNHPAQYNGIGFLENTLTRHGNQLKGLAWWLRIAKEALFRCFRGQCSSKTNTYTSKDKAAIH